MTVQTRDKDVLSNWGQVLLLTYLKYEWKKDDMIRKNEVKQKA